MKWWSWLLPQRAWLMRCHKDAVTVEAQRLLPEPYDPVRYEVERRWLGSVFSEQATDSTGDRSATLKIDDFLSAIRKRVDARAGVTGAGVEAALLYGLDVSAGFTRVDTMIYESMSRLAGEQITTFGDLSAKLETYSHGINGLTDGALHKIGGHVGEVAVASHLEAIGANIEWPNASNQAGWDLLVSGHEVNVKVVQDAASLAEHFHKYPSIPVIVPGDMENIPADAVHFDPTHSIDDILAALKTGKEHLVLVDDALSHTDLAEHVEEATDAALGAADLVDGAFPWVTAALASWREVKLLTDGKTDPGSALKNAGLDVAGAGVGGFAGAKAGVVLGALIGGPIGAAVGGVIGGIGGAIAGKTATSSIKSAKLRGALNEVREHEARLNTAIREEEERVKVTVSAYRTAAETELRAESKKESGHVAHEASRMVEWRNHAATISKSEAAVVLRNAREELVQLTDSVRSALHVRGWFRRWVWPDVYVLAHEYALGRLNDAVRQISLIEAEVHASDRIPRVHLTKTLGESGLARHAVCGIIDAVEQERLRREEHLRNAIRSGRQRIVDLRAQLLQQIATQVQDLHGTVRTRLQLIVDAVREACELANKEAAKLGRT